MNPILNQIDSIINGKITAKDKERVFTYIEFVKMFGYENDANTFITFYKEYVTRWASIKKASITLSDSDFIMSKMIDVLKSITLDYSSYEEQDFIAHIDLTNKSHLKALSALYSRKIREITEFYRKKRNESVMIIRRNSMKGSTKSIQQIIYEKVFDFVFSNRNILPSYKNIKRDLLVSVENYVDTYSQYFDIPRQKEFTDKSRAEMLSANINDVDYRVYLEIELVISQILFSGNVYLEEIPLIAQIGVDLSQSCVGDMLALKNNLMANTQVNQVDLNEQVALKRKLYEKFIGCDLWYMYVDLQGNVTMDVLCKAKNPTGNLLNCGSADTATVENEQLTLLSHIGLFFKPDKTSILKVNAKDYTWRVDENVVQNDTMYVFPDPYRYGDIGNNKQWSYPLIMQYKLDWDIKNLSSGNAVNEPMVWITDQGWASYYSKQDDDFKLIDNKNYEYAFTWLANQGFMTNYQHDMWGNQFGILKGCNVTYKYDEDGNIIGVQKIELEDNYLESQMKNIGSEITANALLLNGGYFENPLYQGYKKQVSILNPNNFDGKWYKDKPFVQPFALYNYTTVDQNGVLYNDFRRVFDDDENKVIVGYQGIVRTDVSQGQIDAAKAKGRFDDYYEQYKKIKTVWCLNGMEEDVRPFDYDKRLILVSTSDDHYQWTGIKIKNEKMYYPNQTTNFINFGRFDRNTRYKYIDHFGYSKLNYNAIEDNENIVTDVLLDFMSKNMYDSGQIKIQKKHSSFDEIKQMKGQMFMRVCDTIDSKPKNIKEVFDFIDWVEIGEPIDFYVIKSNMIIETEKVFVFIPFTFDGTIFKSNLGLRELYLIRKENNLNSKILYVQDKGVVLILQIKEHSFQVDGQNKSFILPTIYTFDVNNYSMKQIINFCDAVYTKDYEQNKLNKIKTFKQFVQQKRRIVGKMQKLNEHLLKQTQNYNNLKNFEIPYNDKGNKIEQVAFSYNSTLGLWLISFVLKDRNETPYIIQHKFKLDNLEYFDGSLKSNVYTIKNVLDQTSGQVDDIHSIYNETTDGGRWSMTPKLKNRETKIFKQIGQEQDQENLGDTSNIMPPLVNYGQQGWYD